MSKEVYSELSITLVKELKKIYDNRDFILCTMNDVWDSPENQQALLDFIRAGDDVDMETVTVMAMELRDARDEREAKR